MDFSYLNNVNFIPKNILDVGCNIGQFYGLCKGRWNNDIKFVLIDGNENVEEDIKRLGVPYHIEILSNSIKTVTWYSTKENPKCTGDSYYRENTKHYADDKLISIEKQTNTLDNLFPDMVFDLIKMDTQGSEIDIVRGGLILCKKAKYIILETSLIEYNLNSPFQKEVNEYMASIGFSEVAIIGIHYLNGIVSQKDILYENSVP